jgi:hypothetical protein
VSLTGTEFCSCLRATEGGVYLYNSLFSEKSQFKDKKNKKMSLPPDLRNYINNIFYFLEKFMAEEKIERQKAKSKGFAALGVPVGSTLTFRKNPEITCKTVDDKNKVEYQGKIYPISGLAKELMKTPISGYHAFKYDGVLLAKLGKEQSSPASVPSPAPQSAETAQVASQTPETPTPQTVPLPRPSEAPVTPQEANPAKDTEYYDDLPDPLAGILPEEETEV